MWPFGPLVPFHVHCFASWSFNLHARPGFRIVLFEKLNNFRTVLFEKLNFGVLWKTP